MLIPNTPDRGLTAGSLYTPFGGDSSLNLIKTTAFGFLRGSWCAGTPLVLYAALLGALAASLGTGLGVTGAEFGNTWAILLLALVAAAAERETVTISSTTEISVGLLPTLFAAVVFGPLAAMFISAASMLGDLRPAQNVPLPHLKWIIYTSTRSITGATAGLASIEGSTLANNKIIAIAAATALAAVTLEVLDVSFFSLTMRLRGNGVREELRGLIPLKVSSLSLFVPVVGLLVFTYQEISPWTLPLFLVPAFAAQRLFILYQDQRKLADDLVSANGRLERANLSFAAALVATLDARDRYTAGHSAVVAEYAKQIADRMELSERQRHLVYLCGLVHDIGKVGLPAGLLEKPGPLTLHERRQMESHSIIGQMILSNVDDYGEIARVVRHHHERVDGRGYPDSLSGDQIPLLSRIIAVADAFDAMTSDRPYREALPARVARLRLAQAVGTQFDTAVVAAFEAILAAQSARRDDQLGVILDLCGDSITPVLEGRGAA
jgi:putative nucleotidyltransferase with HDIG domain